MTLPSPYIIGMVWGCSELALSLLKRSKAGAATHDRNSLTLIWVVNLICVTLAVWLAYHVYSWTLPWRRELYPAACGIFVGGLALRWYAILYLGRFFTVNVAIAADHRLIQSGPYRWVRHPSYSGALLMLLGMSLCIGNVASILVLVLPCTAVCLWRIRIEEAVLAQAFGPEYAAYRQRTKRLIPLVY